MSFASRYVKLADQAAAKGLSTMPSGGVAREVSFSPQICKPGLMSEPSANLVDENAPT